MSYPIEIFGLSKAFSGKSVIDNLTWRIPAGSIVGLLGRNGAGKSTLIECMLGLRDMGSGTVKIFGENVKELSDTNKSRIGYVPQSSDLFEWLTCEQMLDYFRALYPRWNHEKVSSLMQRWELPYDKLISKLSIGQKQRLSIIRALAHDPELLILDEPVASLDPAARRDFLRELVEAVSDESVTILFSTHILSDLERVAMQVAFLSQGQIIHQQGLDDLMEESLQITATQELITALKPQKLFRTSAAANGLQKILAQFNANDTHDLLQRSDLRVERLGLEDLFIEMTK